MAVDATTVILTAIFTGVGVSIGNSLFEIFFKDYFKKLKSHKKRIQNLRLLDYKSPWIAAILNFFFWGIGYFYVGKKKFLGVIMFLIQVFIVGAFSFAQNDVRTASEGITYTLMLILITLFLAYDAFKLAKAVNKDK